MRLDSAVDLRLLIPFLTLADELHFSRAAERLHIAQPALSQQIAWLERQLGFQLFDRPPRPIALTAAGRTLLDRVTPALALLEQGVLEGKALAGEQVALWVPRTRSRHATRRYSCTRPASRTRRSG